MVHPGRLTPPDPARILRALAVTIGQWEALALEIERDIPCGGKLRALRLARDMEATRACLDRLLSPEDGTAPD